jgi:hypothetical protein
MNRPLVFLATLTLPAVLHAQILYGVTAANLVTVDLGTATTSVVGSLGLAPNVLPGTLAWNPADQSLYGIAYQYAGLTVTDQLFLRINPATGAATTLAHLGPQSGMVYDGLEYVNSLGSLVIAHGPGAGDSHSTQLATISAAGTLSALVGTGLDNDILAYDSGHDTLYSLDPNNVGQFQRVNLQTGAGIGLGAEPSATTGEMAYSPTTDRLYALDYTLGNHSLYVINTHDGNGPAQLESTFTLDGEQVQGIAFAAVPEPAEWTAFGGLGLLAWALVRRRP